MSRTSESAYVVTPADELFGTLDDTSIDVGDRRWRIEVCGVHAHGPRNWIQLNLLSHGCHAVTVRVDRLDAPNVRSLLRSWLSGVLSSEPSLTLATAPVRPH
jgi:hypothetical protein